MHLGRGVGPLARAGQGADGAARVTGAVARE